MMTYTGRLHPKGVPFSGFRYTKGQGFHLFKNVEMQGNLSFGSVTRSKKGKQMNLWRYKVEKTFHFVIDYF